ncbi:hypothetical protein PEC106568_00790 [Pectobacterium carotovorum subsp. carotovorum]|nr:hypothetical protein PEC106568_00790 [Pectobacterium carotovorum subsp. carotovorum]
MSDKETARSGPFWFVGHVFWQLIVAINLHA